MNGKLVKKKGERNTPGTIGERTTPQERDHNHRENAPPHGRVNIETAVNTKKERAKYLFGIWIESGGTIPFYSTTNKVINMQKTKVPPTSKNCQINNILCTKKPSTRSPKING